MCTILKKINLAFLSLVFLSAFTPSYGSKTLTMQEIQTKLKNNSALKEKVKDIIGVLTKKNGKKGNTLLLLLNSNPEPNYAIRYGAQIKVLSNIVLIQEKIDEVKIKIEDFKNKFKKDDKKKKKSINLLKFLLNKNKKDKKDENVPEFYEVLKSNNKEAIFYIALFDKRYGEIKGEDFFDTKKQNEVLETLSNLENVLKDLLTILNKPLRAPQEKKKKAVSTGSSYLSAKDTGLYEEDGATLKSASSQFKIEISPMQLPTPTPDDPSILDLNEQAPTPDDPSIPDLSEQAPTPDDSSILDLNEQTPTPDDLSILDLNAQTTVPNGTNGSKKPVQPIENDNKTTAGSQSTLQSNTSNNNTEGGAENKLKIGAFFIVIFVSGILLSKKKKKKKKKKHSKKKKKA